MNIKRVKPIRKIKEDLRSAKQVVLLTEQKTGRKMGLGYEDSKKFVEKMKPGNKNTELLQKFHENQSALKFQNMAVKQIHDQIQSIFEQAEYEEQPRSSRSQVKLNKVRTKGIVFTEEKKKILRNDEVFLMKN